LIHINKSVLLVSHFDTMVVDLVGVVVS